MPFFLITLIKNLNHQNKTPGKSSIIVATLESPGCMFWRDYNKFMRIDKAKKNLKFSAVVWEELIEGKEGTNNLHSAIYHLNAKKDIGSLYFIR